MILENELPREENQTVEFKRYEGSSKFCRNVWREVAGMSSTESGGNIYIGIEDEKSQRGPVSGVENPRYFQKMMFEAQSGCIDAVEVDWAIQPILVADGSTKQVVIITVSPSSVPVYAQTKDGEAMAVYIRQGERCVGMPPDRIVAYHRKESEKIVAVNKSVAATVASLAAVVESDKALVSLATSTMMANMRSAEASMRFSLEQNSIMTEDRVREIVHDAVYRIALSALSGLQPGKR